MSEECRKGGYSGRTDVADIPDRRKDDGRRRTIEDYRQMAWQAKTDASNAKDPETRKRCLARAKSLTELADKLQGRASNKDTTRPEEPDKLV